MDKKHDIFVSYSRHDTNVVNEFVERLEREGFSVWIDRDGIESGDAFKKIILQAIKNSAVVLFFSSQFSNQSGWTAKEIGVAVKYKKTVIPILLDGSNYNEEVEFDLINLDFIDYQDVTVRGIMMDRLVKSLKTKITNPMGQKKAEEARLKAEAAERERLEKERLKKEEAEKKAREEAERQAREAAERERRALQATSVSPTPHSDTPNPPKKKTLWIALAATAAVALLLLLLLKPKKEEPVVVDPDTETYQACQTVQDYRHYIAYYGLHAEHYAEAKDFIDRYLADSLKLVQDSLTQVAEEYYRQGLKYYYDGNYEKAVELYRKSSDLENAKGQTGLGRMYEKGLGVNQDYREAVKWYRKAAEKGDALGQANLGYMYIAGYGVAQDYQEALKWCRKAVEQGEAYGQVNLAWMYRDGKGVAQNYQEAMKLYRKAAEQGNVIGQTNVGYMYENGLGVATDRQEAIKWYRKAAQQGDDYSQKALKRLGEK